MQTTDLKMIKIGESFPYMVENTVEKGENDHDNPFLQCFQKSCTSDTKEKAQIYQGKRYMHFKAHFVY